MVQVKWTLQSLDDIDAISEYISRDSAYYAQLFVEKILNSTDRIAFSPKSGRLVPEIHRNDVREIILGNYRIIYHVADEFVAILTVYHSSRLLDPDNLDI